MFAFRFIVDHFPIRPHVKKPPKRKPQPRGRKPAMARRDSFIDDDSAASANESDHRLDDDLKTSVPSISTDPIPSCVDRRDSFLARVRKMNLPPSPLDELLDKLGGPTAVAEMTGRSRRYIRNRAGKLVLESRGSGGTGEDAMNDINVIERSKFMSGEKLIAIISDAASTGISLHADRAVKNQRKRMHLTMVWRQNTTNK